MKRFAFICSALSAALLLSQCKTAPPPAPGDGAYRGAQVKAYRAGYHHGFMDGGNGLDENFERYHDEYQNETAEVFARGYHVGHEAGRQQQSKASTSDQDRAWRDGYDAGRADCENSLSPSFKRHRAEYSTATEASYSQGYTRGFHDFRSQ
ncbi:MAG: hypothetical protein WCN98_19880 [Verrucomicrobiaceae bacterium]